MYDELMFELSSAHRELRRSADGRSADQLAAGLRQLAGLRAALDACEARWLAAFDAVQGWKQSGAADAAAWLREQTGSSYKDAARRAHTAEGLSQLPEVAGALADGMITHEHASALARAVDRDPDVADHQAELLGRAVGQSADAFERTVRSWTLRRAADQGASAFERQHARRALTSTTVDDGMTQVQARLDPVAGATVMSALDRIAEELWRGDTDGARTLDLHVRRADALVELARRAMAVDPASARRSDPTVIVLVDHQTLAGQLAAAGLCDLADGTPIAPGTARRLACGAGILPIVLDGKSRPLDLGTAQRYASAAQRQALIVRDGGCVICGLPWWMCDAHHLVPHPGGPTDLENLVFVCDGDHHLLHEGGWTLERTEDGGWIARSPDGFERIRPPRRQRSPDPPAPPAHVDQHDQLDQLDLLAS